MITPLMIGQINAELGRWFGLPEVHPLAAEKARLPLFCFHIALPGRSVLVDAAVYDFEPENTRFVVPGSAEPSLTEQLAAFGIAAAEITDVVLTHSHFDHINGVTCQVAGVFRPTFPNARHYLGEHDFQPKKFSRLEARTLGLLYEAGLLQLVDGRLHLSDGLTIIPTPGETPGHQSLLLETAVGQALFLGDLYHHPLEFNEPDRHVVWADRRGMQRSKEMVQRMAADKPIDLFFAHIEGSFRILGNNFIPT